MAFSPTQVAGQLIDHPISTWQRVDQSGSTSANPYHKEEGPSYTKPNLDFLFDTGILTPPPSPKIGTGAPLASSSSVQQEWPGFNRENISQEYVPNFDTVKIRQTPPSRPLTPPSSTQRLQPKIITPSLATFTPLKTGTTTSSVSPSLRFQNIPDHNVPTKRYIRISGVREDMTLARLRELLSTFGAVSFIVFDHTRSTTSGKCILVGFHDYRTGLAAWPKLKAEAGDSLKQVCFDHQPVHISLEWVSRTQVSAINNTVLSKSEATVLVTCPPCLAYAALWRALAEIADVRAIAEVETGAVFVVELCDDRQVATVFSALDQRIISGHRVSVQTFDLDKAFQFQHILEERARKDHKTFTKTSPAVPAIPLPVFDNINTSDPVKPALNKSQAENSALSALRTTSSPFTPTVKKVSKRNLPPPNFDTALENDPFSTSQESEKVQGTASAEPSKQTTNAPTLPFTRIESPRAVFGDPSVGRLRAPHHEEKGNQIDLDAVKCGYDSRKILMLGNVPASLSRDNIRDMLDSIGLRGCYDFLYLRNDFSSRKNMRYAFCSFTSTAHILTLYAGLSGRRWHPSQSINMFQASYANHQSMAGYIRKFRNSAVMTEAPHMRPQLFYTDGPLKGQVKPFPAPDNAERVIRSLEEKRIGLHRKAPVVQTTRLFARAFE